MKTELYTPDYYIIDGSLYPFCGVIRAEYPELGSGEGKIKIFFNSNHSVTVEALHQSVNKQGQKILNLFSDLDDYYKYLDVLI